MSLEYMDDDELVYQAKSAAKDIVNAKYEVTKKVGDFLFLAHSEEEFYQRAIAVDPILESTSTRRLASVSDSKAKLVKALFQEWEIKHASCDGCHPVNFNLPGRVAAPILPIEKTTQQVGPARSGRLWDKWSFIQKKKDDDGLIRRDLFEEKDDKGNPKVTPESRDLAKAGIIGQIVGNSLGRLDDPEVFKQVVPGSALWIDPYGLYGQDKKRKFSAIRGRREQTSSEDSPSVAEASNFTAMIGRVPGRASLGNSGVFLTHHKCTGNSFRGFNGNTTGSFPQCQHEHHEGDGCGRTESTDANAPRIEGTMQPGCGKQHLVVSAMTPQFLVTPKNGEAGTTTTPLPYLEDERKSDFFDNKKSLLEMYKNQAKSPEQAAALHYTNPTQEQLGEIPLDRMFLLHPDDADRFANVLDSYHQAHGGQGRHPANLEKFQIGDSTHRVGDIVSLQQGETARHSGTENNLGIVVGATAHRNGLFTRFARNHGLGANTDNDSSRVDSKPGEYSLMIHRLNDPTTGQSPPTAVDPDTNQVVPKQVNEISQHYPSSNVNTIESTNPNKYNNTQKLYKRLKNIQRTFTTKPEKIRSTESPKTVKPSRSNLDISSLDLNDLFGNLE